MCKYHRKKKKEIWKLRDGIGRMKSLEHSAYQRKPCKLRVPSYFSHVIILARLCKAHAYMLRPPFDPTLSELKRSRREGIQAWWTHLNGFDFGTIRTIWIRKCVVSMERECEILPDESGGMMESGEHDSAGAASTFPAYQLRASEPHCLVPTREECQGQAQQGISMKQRRTRVSSCEIQRGK